MFFCQYNPLYSIIIDYNGFFREVNHETYKFFQSYLISCLVQLLRITFQKILHLTFKFIFFVSTFSI